MTHAELHALLDVVQRQFPEHHAEVAVMAYTTMRAGEVFALKWDCVDFERQEIKVKRSISAGEKKAQEYRIGIAARHSRKARRWAPKGRLCQAIRA